MNLREEILKEHSRRQALTIAAWVDNDERKFESLLDLFLHDEYRVVQRNVVRVLQYIQIPVKFQAKIMNLCFEYLTDPKETIAVRVFSMTVLANLAAKYPEIKNEIEQVITMQLRNPSAGLRSRSRKVLEQLQKL
jgi:hypothetical protein